MPFGISRAVVGSRIQYVIVSDGAGDALRPIALGDDGKLDPSLFDTPGDLRYLKLDGTNGPATTISGAPWIFTGDSDAGAPMYKILNNFDSTEYSFQVLPGAGINRTWYFQDINTDATFAWLEGAQTFTGAKTFPTAGLFVRDSDLKLYSRADGDIGIQADVTAILGVAAATMELSEDTVDSYLTFTQGSVYMTTPGTGFATDKHWAMGNQGVLSTAQILSITEESALGRTGVFAAITGSPTTTGKRFTGGDLSAIASSSASATISSVTGITLAANNIATVTTTNQRIIIGSSLNIGTGAITNLYGCDLSSSNATSAQTITNMFGFRFTGSHSVASSVVTNYTGFESNFATLAASGGTNAYGFRAKTLSTNFTNRWSFYADADPAFFGGSIQVNGNTIIGDATTDTVRFNAGGNAAAPGTNAIGVILDYFGTSATRVLTTPNRWWSIIADDGNTYKIPLYT